jgi:hypothetical protein
VSEQHATRIIERRGGAEIVLRRSVKYGTPAIAKDGGRRSDWGRGAAGFWNKVRKEGESPGACWVWTGYIDPDGYGKFCSTALRADGKSRSARPHRLAWQWENGPIPPGMVLMHLCDVPACVNPEHLRPATQAENIRDCWAKGRHENRNDTRGEMSGRAILRNEDVLFIRAQARVRCSIPLLARLYGVSIHTLYQVKYRKTWRHLGNGSAPNAMPIAALRKLIAQREHEASAKTQASERDDLANRRTA